MKIKNITVWQKNYTDNSIDVFIQNVNKSSYTFSGITSDAKIWIIHSNTSGNGTVRLFDYSTVSTPSHIINSQNGGQCDITL